MSPFLRSLDTEATLTLLSIAKRLHALCGLGSALGIRFFKQMVTSPAKVTMPSSPSTSIREALIERL